MTAKLLEGFIKFGADCYAALADQLLLKQEADRTCDRVNEAGRAGDVAAFDAELGRLETILRAMDRDSGTGEAS